MYVTMLEHMWYVYNYVVESININIHYRHQHSLLSTSINIKIH